MSAIEFHRAQPGDAAMVRALVREAYAKWVPIINREPRPMTADYDRALREHVITLATRDAAVLGLIETRLHPDHLWIENVAVRPASQGMSIGRRLLAHAERMAAEAGRGELRLLTNAAFTVNIALYERVGYVIDRRDASNGWDVVHMSKRL
jgi:ribosomal protein S18 acetylase RimI-like enzyme